MPSEQSVGSTDRLKRTEFRCEKCYLPRADCCCSFPEMVEGSNCGRCGTWKPLRYLDEISPEGAVKFQACRSCRDRSVGTGTDRAGTDSVSDGDSGE